MFLFFLEAQIKVEKSVREASQNCLDETGSLITSLERAQRQRLSKTPPPHLANIMPPSDLELQLGKHLFLIVLIFFLQISNNPISLLFQLRKSQKVLHLSLNSLLLVRSCL